jgi:ATP-dependent helicase/nuclease subunit A
MNEIRKDRPPPTLEQVRALEVSGSSVALSAGAGTGKTFVLAERFVRALEGPDARPLGRVVALTFTNKAARELRERIRRECRARLEHGEDPLRWRAVLRGLEAARIGTFHAFCGDVLRRHAIEAGVDPGFAVLDESIALSIRQEALAKTLREALTGRDADLIDLAVEYGLGMVRQSIDNLLANRSAGEIRDWADREPRSLVDAWVRIWNEEVQPELMASFRETLRPCLELIDGNEFDNPKVRARLGELREAVARLEVPGDPVPTLERIGEAAKVQGLTAKTWPSPEIYESIKDLFGSIRDEIKKLKKLLPWCEPATMAAASQGLKFARLTVKARETYDQAKRNRGGIDNDDLLLLTRDLLNGPSSLARDALASSVDLVLVDEFQDTDPVQAEILERLAGPGLLDGKLFLVGDVKQSIYRFRGARPELFGNYRERFPSQGRLELSANFRSVPAILAFANALFASTFTEANSALRPGSETVAIDDDATPAVEFLWGSNEANEASKPDANARRKDEARRIARHLKTRLDQGWTIVDPGDKQLRPANQGDIAFLFRSLSDASDYEQALVAEGLDYHVVGGSGFYAQQEVLDLINVLTAVEDPLDAVSLAGALRSPFFSISDDALFWIATERFGQPHEGLQRCSGTWLEKLSEVDRPRAERARRLLDRWRGVKDQLPIAGLVDRILTESGYEAALIGEFLGDRKRANARKLVQMARRFDEQGGFTLADFVARLRADLRGATKETQAATTDEEGEIIRLMSIHQAKGLEFPIVVLPDLDRKRPGELKRVAFDPELGPLVNPVIEAGPGDDGEEVESGDCLGWTIHRHRERLADDAEALRLFYVAVTRARNALVISSATEPSKRPTSPAMTLLDRRFDRLIGRFQEILPDGWPEPRVCVVEPAKPSSPSLSTASRPRPRLLEVARAIEEGLSRPSGVEVVVTRRPRSLDLDPTHGLSSTSARLDRLIRTILVDPRSLEPKLMEPIAIRAARMQDPVSPQSLIEMAIDRLTAWARTPEAREISRSSSVRRSFEWVIGWPEVERSTDFRGRGDFLFRLSSGGDGLVCLSDPGASEDRERLRLLLSAEAAERMGLGKVRKAWWVRPGSPAGPMVIDRFDRSTIDRAIDRVLGLQGTGQK